MESELKKASAHTILPVERLGDTLVVVPHGDLHGYSPHIFHAEYERIQSLLDDPTIHNLIVDLGGSRYFGSQMIGALVAMREKVIGRGRAVLTDVSTDTQAGLQLIRADSLFEFFDTRSQAIRRVARLSPGQRLRRRARPLAWIAGLLLLAGIGWGLYVSKVGYAVFGSRSARTYAHLSREWTRYQAAQASWAPEEGDAYRSKLLDELQSVDEQLQTPRLFPVREDHWLRRATASFQSEVRGDSEPESLRFLRRMRYARHFINKRTGLNVPRLGPEVLRIASDSDDDFDAEAAATDPELRATPAGTHAAEN